MNTDSSWSCSVAELGRALRAVGLLIDGIRASQWSAPTPCSDWTVRDLVTHLVNGNLIFAATLAEQDPPERGRLPNDPARAFRDSGDALLRAFNQPGVFDRTFHSALGAATGADRLQIRIYDLLAHGWDLAQATSQPVDLPVDLAEKALAFVKVQLSTMPRTGRFDNAQPVPDDAPAIERLVAYLGRPVGPRPRG